MVFRFYLLKLVKTNVDYPIASIKACLYKCFTNEIMGSFSDIPTVQNEGVLYI